MSYEDLGYDNLLGVPKTDKTVNSVNNQAFMEDGAIDLSQTSVSKIKVRQTISSENYQAGVSGWSINGDGSAEFRNVTIAGYKIYEAIIASDGTGNYTTIQDAVAAGAKKIFLRNGTYTLTANLSISNSDVSIEGETRDGVIIQSSTPYYNILVTGNNFSLLNLTIINCEISLTSIRDATIQNILIRQTLNHSFIAIKFTTCTGSVIKDCETRLSDTSYSSSVVAGGYSLYLDTCTDFSVFNNLFGGGAQEHIRIFQCQRIVIDGNIIKQDYLLYSSLTFSYTAVDTTTNQITLSSSPSDYQAVTFTTTGTLPSPLVAGTFYYARVVDATHISIYGTTFNDIYNGSTVDLTTQGTGTHTIRFWSTYSAYGVNVSSSSDNIIVSNNTITSVAYNGYAINSNCNNFSLIGNSIQGYAYGISIDTQYNTNISNNRISQCSFAGIIGGFASNTGYGGHIISNNNIYKTLKYGFCVWPVVRAIFSSNTVLMCLSHGFYGNGTGNFFYMTMDGNRFDFNGGSGIYFNPGTGYDLSDSSITGNNCWNNSGWGLYITYSSANVITSNIFNGNSLGQSSISDTFSQIANNIGL